MTQIKLEDLIRQSADQAQFEFNEDHMAQAMDMIRQKRRRRVPVWWWVPLLLLPAVGLWWLTSHPSKDQANVGNQKTEAAGQEQLSIDEHEGSETYHDANPGYASNASKSEILTKGESETSKLSPSSPNSNEAKSGHGNIDPRETKPFSNMIPGTSDSDSGLSATESQTDELATSPITVVLPRSVWSTDGLSIQNELALLSVQEQEIKQIPGLRKMQALPTFSGFFDLQYQPSGGTVSHRGSLGLKVHQNLGRKSYLGLEIAAVVNSGFTDDYLIQQVDDYGVEVHTQFYKVQPRWMAFGRTALVYGVRMGRFGVEAGPSLAFAPMAYGSIDEVVADDGKYSEVRNIGEGLISVDNSDPVIFGAQMDAWYQLTPLTRMGLTLQYDRGAFFNKNDIRTSRGDQLYLGMKYQWRF